MWRYELIGQSIGTTKGCLKSHLTMCRPPAFATPWYSGINNESFGPWQSYLLWAFRPDIWHRRCWCGCFAGLHGQSSDWTSSRVSRDFPVAMASALIRFYELRKTVQIGYPKHMKKHAKKNTSNEYDPDWWIGMIGGSSTSPIPYRAYSQH